MRQATKEREEKKMLAEFIINGEIYTITGKGIFKDNEKMKMSILELQRYAASAGNYIINGGWIAQKLKEEIETGWIY